MSCCDAVAGRTLVDDAEGRAISLAQVARVAAAAHREHLAKQQQAEGQERALLAAGRRQLAAGPQQGATAAAAGGGTAAQANAEARLAPRMSGVYLGCLENKGGFFPIRDPSSKW